MTTNDAVACVLVAAGRGERLGRERPKAFVEVAGRPLVWHAMSALARTRVGRVVVVVPEGYRSDVSDLVPTLPAGSAEFQAVTGGSTRQESVALGLAALTDTVDVVLVHDAARCLTPPELYDAVADEVRRGRDAVVPGLPPVDTLKRVDADGRVTATPNRAEFRSIQTPQGFRRDLLAHAYAAAEERGETEAPDDASLVERLGMPVFVVSGHPDAFKITRPHDLLAAEAVLARQAAAR